MPQLRPKEEPVVLPSRVREESRGSVNSRQVGMDDVSPIGGWGGSLRIRMIILGRG